MLGLIIFVIFIAIFGEAIAAIAVLAIGAAIIYWASWYLLIPLGLAALAYTIIKPRHSLLLAKSYGSLAISISVIISIFYASIFLIYGFIVWVVIPTVQLIGWWSLVPLTLIVAMSAYTYKQYIEGKWEMKWLHRLLQHLNTFLK